MSDFNIAGLAALSAVEALLIALAESGVITMEEKDGILADAETAHRNAAKTEDDAAMHSAVAELLAKLRRGADGVRHSWIDN